MNVQLREKRAVYSLMCERRNGGSDRSGIEGFCALHKYREVDATTADVYLMTALHTVCERIDNNHGL